MKNSSDPEEINKAVDELLQASHKIAEKMYKQQTAQQAGAGGAEAQATEEPSKKDEDKGDEGAMDADFEVVDDDK